MLFFNVQAGNWDTLEVRPKEKKLDIRQELLKFYEYHYSANLMHLVIYTKGSILIIVTWFIWSCHVKYMNLCSWICLDGLDKSESLVRSYFEDIQNTNRNLIIFPGQPCNSENLQVPLVHLYSVTLTYPVARFLFPFYDNQVYGKIIWCMTMLC